MSVDKHEELLARVFEILQTIPNTNTAVRNRGLLDNEMRPGLVLLDGDAFSKVNGAGRGRVRMSPQMMEARPQVFVVMDTRLPQNANLGQDMNAIAFAIIQAIAQDQPLLDIIGSNGDVTLIRAETDLKSGSAVRGQTRLDFTIVYWLDPYQV